MPLPWGAQIHDPHRGPKFPREAIEVPKDRALTLRQLHDLQDFVKRLCKSGLLRYPDDQFNKHRAGKSIKWTRISQHEIVSTVIRKIIPKEHSCSWTELVAHGQPQTRKFFCSHSWAETFRDFMAAIDLHARENGVSIEDTYWICVYANDQFHLELGKTLEQSPFYTALQGAHSTLLMLDKAADALNRLWVIFEMNETTRLGQRLFIWTPLGQVGTGLVGSGPIMQALGRLDTSEACASHPVDQRQIMNFVAGINELEGICFAEDGVTKQLKPSMPQGTHEHTLRTEFHVQF